MWRENICNGENTAYSAWHWLYHSRCARAEVVLAKLVSRTGTVRLFCFPETTNTGFFPLLGILVILEANDHGHANISPILHTRAHTHTLEWMNVLSRLLCFCVWSFTKYCSVEAHIWNHLSQARGSLWTINPCQSISPSLWNVSMEPVTSLWGQAERKKGKSLGGAMRYCSIIFKASMLMGIYCHSDTPA